MLPFTIANILQTFTIHEIALGRREDCTHAVLNLVFHAWCEVKTYTRGKNDVIN